MHQKVSFQSSLFQLGKIPFTVFNCDGEYVQSLDRLFPLAPLQDKSLPEVVNVQTDCTKDIQSLVNYVASRHINCVAVSGSFLISPEGKRLLLVGSPRVGRTTTSMELVLNHNWKLFTNELILLDHVRRKLIPLIAPFRYDEKTAQLLGSAAPAQTVKSTWIGAKPLYCSTTDYAVNEEFDPSFDLCCWLEPFSDSAPDSSELESVETGQIFTKLLPLSNLLRAKNASDIFFEAMQNGSCTVIRGQELASRIDSILNLG